VCIAAETTQEEVHLLIHHGVLGHQVVKCFLFSHIGQFTVQQQVTHIHKIAVLSQLLNGVAAIQQLALVTVNVSNG